MREEETKRTSQNSKMQQFFRKRWVFPAIYLVSAALILTAVLWYQALGNGDSANDPIDQGTSYQDEPTQEVNSAVENFAMPAVDSDAVSVIRKFYEKDATAAEQEAALVSYNNTYEPSKGIDLAKEDGKEFEVAASLSGTVTKAEKDPLLGNVIEIEHKDGVTTVYQSLASMMVAAGDEVEQNEIIGQAGKSLIQEEDGVHVHFEIRKDGVAVNPLDFMDKPLTSLNDVNVEKEAEPVKEQPVKEEEGTEGEEKGAEEEKGTEQEKEDAEKGTEDKKGAEEDKEKEDAGKEGSEKGNSQDQSEASISTKNA
ncbi:peptidoglycan DD-metalloendopeptidase family protein [Bacillus sp. OVS6]|uniref:M23 family metallopeptidase n=1 Tax=Metabacillus dongyingensis TaxID=2874282 RepID=UPI001CBC36D4|nr:M23 family metallopeptidase [Metabacillus dongyingensis]UAL52100.1 peptidoglycan DD-metalloendopeptidase family protein [Metabacillus dongyingensis]UOK57899.1 peptidoglycan DD-metalloendopeptidase family protein [Bacillus sp. OVS6]